MQLVSRKKAGSKQNSGFTNFDELFLSLVAAMLQAKLHQIQANQLQRAREREVVSTLKAASVISTQRSYVDYIMNCSKILPEFFGFEGVGILFRDHETNNLFSIEQDEAEGEGELKRQKLNQTLSSENAMADAQRQFRRRGKQVYPNSLGITGQAFQTGEVIYTNRVEKMNGFLPSIDNLTTNVTEVHSFMIVPIFGH